MLFLKQYTVQYSVSSTLIFHSKKPFSLYFLRATALHIIGQIYPYVQKYITFNILKICFFNLFIMCTYNLITLVQETTYPIILWGRWNSKGDWEQVVQLITGEHERTRQVWEETKRACQNTDLTRGERDTNTELYRTRIKPLIDRKKKQTD